MGKENSDKHHKISWTSRESILKDFSEDEVKYRSKYLPDPSKLSSNKIVCTVCSSLLASDILKGNNLYIHKVLQVLLCQDCFQFYGDGYFSVDEDGDDKYCCWCGQGGTLYLCSACTCGFCRKCLKKNLKSSQLAELEKDDWRCLVCVPRPLFGPRAICWAAQELNKTEKDKNQSQLITEAETSKVNVLSKRRRLQSEDSDSSSISIPFKIRKHETVNTESLNVAIEKQGDMSSDNETLVFINKDSIKRLSESDDDSVTSSSKDDSFEIEKQLILTNKIKSIISSEISSVEEPKRTTHLQNVETISPIKHNTSDSSSSEVHDEHKTTELKTNIEETPPSNLSSEDEKELVKANQKTDISCKVTCAEKEGSLNDIIIPENRNTGAIHSSEIPSDIVKTNLENPVNKSVVDTVEKICEHIDKEMLIEQESNSGEISARDCNVDENIKQAIEWLSSIVSDISEIGGLIAIRASNFGEKRLNLDNLNTYDDVLVTLSKLKKLFSGIHTNFTHIDRCLEDKLGPWKILTGLDVAEKDTNLVMETSKSSDSVESDKRADDIVSELTKDLNVAPTDSYTNDDIEQENTNFVVGDPKICSLESMVRDVAIESVINNKEEELYNGSSGNKDVNSDICSLHLNCNTDICNAESGSGEKQNVNTAKREENDDDNDQNDNSSNENNMQSINEIKNVESFNNSNHSTVENNNNNTQNINYTKEINKTVISENVAEEQMFNEITEKENIPNFDIEKAHSLINSVIPSVDWCNETCNVKTVEENEESFKEKKDTSNNTESRNDNNVGQLQVVPVHEDCPVKEDPQNTEALQLLLYSSSDEETKSLQSDSDESDEIQLDDSDLDILKPRKSVFKKKVRSKKKENISQAKSNCIEEKEERKRKKVEGEELDSETEINMLIDLSKLKKKTHFRKLLPMDSSGESSEESFEVENDTEKKDSSRKGKKYNNESKKRREEERNELFGFLKGESSSDDEMDITKKDLDVLEDQYASSSSSSMSLQNFSEKMNAKWKELEKQQEEMNLQILLAPESEEGSEGEDDIILDPDEKKEKTGPNKKIKEETNKEVAAETEIKKEDVSNDGNSNDSNVIDGPDDEYEQFLENMTKSRTTFKGLGSSSDVSEEGNDIEIKEEPLSDEMKIKKEPKGSNSNLSSTSSDTSGDVFVNKGMKSMKKKSWRKHRLLRIKLCDTDTSDEERCWQRRVQKELKKRQSKSDRPKKNVGEKIKLDIGSEKEIKEEIKLEEEGGSSTLELSSSDSSSFAIFQKKRKRKEDTSDSDIELISDEDKKKKKKKKKKRSRSEDSSDESNDSGDDVMEISQKSTQGESPGKGGRKNIRKVLTKHELAAATKAAAKEEEERKKRIAARQKLFNEMFEIKEAEVLQKLVLDFDPDTKTELISVDRDLVIKMKPHQAKGVKFMWDSCFESVSQLKTKKGSGCILAHCMGLGKTFQVISLVHTILTHKDTNVNTVLVVCPLSTVLNWYSEFDKWLDGVAGGSDINIYHLTKYKKAHERSRHLSQWQRDGGVMVLGYEMFRILTNQNSKVIRLRHKEIFQKTLIDPGADLVVCDEGHMLKNESTVLSKAMSRIRTLRRIVLTGTPMQNNLKEYHCMVQFVKPNLLGTRKEFLNQFVNPITNGQFVDSTESDVKVMKRRSHVLHKMLEGLVQRCDYNVLTPFLPPKHEYVISLRLSEIQVQLYQFYLDHFSQMSKNTQTGSQLFSDWQALGRIWTHPLVLKMSTDKAEKEREKRRLEESEGEGSIKDFIEDKSSLNLSSSNSSSSDNDETKDSKKEESEKIDIKTPSTAIETEINLISSDEEDNDKNLEEKQNEEITTVNSEGSVNNKKDIITKEGEEKDDEKENIDQNKDHEENEKGNNNGDINVDEEKVVEPDANGDKQEKADENVRNAEKKQLDSKSAWWKHIIQPEHLEDINQSAKLILLFAILRECEMIEDKVLVFSQSLFSLDLIEYFLEKVDKATEDNRADESLGNNAGCWTKGLDYFRLDGSSSSENRSAWCKTFNREDNPRARLFLISTRAGGLGINLTGANRVVIFDASWNPAHDIQSIFRIYRFGQKKACYVYRFIAHGTMEEKVYDRQVAKQSLSSRVVDEQQVHRHFSMNDLNELYTFTAPVTQASDRPTPALPHDRLMAELLTQYSEWIEKYHEHDSLLENIVEEELNEEERKLAWEDFENDKKRGVLPLPTGASTFPNSNMTNQMELFRKSLRNKYPNSTEQEMNAMLQTLMYQVNCRVAQNMMQPLSTQPPQPQALQGTATSQTVSSQNVQMTAEQMFNLQRNHLYNKYGQQMQMKSGQKIGNVQIKQNQSVKNVQTKIGTTPDNTYMRQMRIQQLANMARVENQRKIQQEMQHNQISAARHQLNNIYQTQITQQSNVQNRQIQAVPNSQQTRRNRQTVQNRPLSVKPSQVTNNWTPAQQSQLTMLQNPRQIPSTKVLNNKPLGVTSNKNHNQSLQKSSQQLKKEEMQRRIIAMQQQQGTSLQHKMKQRQVNTAGDAVYKRKLEEMENRYKATRKNLSGAVSVVEIDDEPSRP